MAVGVSSAKSLPYLLDMACVGLVAGASGRRGTERVATLASEGMSRHLGFRAGSWMSCYAIPRPHTHPSAGGGSPDYFSLSRSSLTTSRSLSAAAYPARRRSYIDGGCHTHLLAGEAATRFNLTIHYSPGGN